MKKIHRKVTADATAAEMGIPLINTTSSQTISNPHVSSISCLGERENELANKWIKELSELSLCQKCNGIVRAAVEHQMNTKSKNEFLKEVMKYDLSVKTIPLLEYKEVKNCWCKCIS